MEKKTILVLGAQGMLGRFTAKHLAAAGHHVLRAGRRPEDAADFRFVDLDRIETFVAALKGVDLVVSSIEDPEVRAEREILRRGRLLISQATLPTPARRLLERDAARRAKGTVVLNSGLTGVMGLVVKDLIAQNPGADTVEIGFIASVAASIGMTGSRTAHSWFTSVPRLSVTRRLFTAPRGIWPCFDMSTFDHLWLSEAQTGQRKVMVYIGLAERAVANLLRFLDGVSLLKKVPQGAFTALAKGKAPPTALTREPIRMRAAVSQDGKVIAARGIDAEGDYNSTTLSTAMFAQRLLDLAGRGGVQAGVYCVEDLFDLAPVRAALVDNRIVVHPLTA